MRLLLVVLGLCLPAGFLGLVTATLLGVEGDGERMLVCGVVGFCWGWFVVAPLVRRWFPGGAWR